MPSQPEELWGQGQVCTSLPFLGELTSPGENQEGVPTKRMGETVAMAQAQERDTG